MAAFSNNGRWPRAVDVGKFCRMKLTHTLWPIFGRHRYLLISMLFSLSLVLWRVIYTGSISYVFLIWNLFLAFIPFAISEFGLKESKRGLTIRNGMAALLCLAFLPNSPYIITDLFHLRWHSEPSIWYDTVLIASCAWNGLLLFFHTLVNVDHKLLYALNRRNAWMVKLLVIILCAFGIYLGRYLRFNSWDILSNPLSLFEEIARRVIHPRQYALAWSMTILYALFLTFTYLNFIGFTTGKRTTN